MASYMCVANIRTSPAKACADSWCRKNPQHCDHRAVDAFSYHFVSSDKNAPEDICTFTGQNCLLEGLMQLSDDAIVMRNKMISAGLQLPSDWKFPVQFCDSRDSDLDPVSKEIGRIQYSGGGYGKTICRWAHGKFVSVASAHLMLTNKTPPRKYCMFHPPVGSSYKRDHFENTLVTSLAFSPTVCPK